MTTHGDDGKAFIITPLLLRFLRTKIVAPFVERGLLMVVVVGASGRRGPPVVVVVQTARGMLDSYYHCKV